MKTHKIIKELLLFYTLKYIIFMMLQSDIYIILLYKPTICCMRYLTENAPC